MHMDRAYGQDRIRVWCIGKIGVHGLFSFFFFLFCCYFGSLSQRLCMEFALTGSHAGYI